MDDEYLQRLGGTPPRPPSHSGSPRRPARASETYGDRFIPLRTGSSIAADTMLESMSREGQPAESNTDPKDEPGKVTYNLLLRNEVLGANVTAAGADERRANPLTLDNVFSYRESHVASPARESHSPFSLSPVGSSSQRLLQSPRKHPRKIAKVPFKVLDAPDLQVCPHRSRSPPATCATFLMLLATPMNYARAFITCYSCCFLLLWPCPRVARNSALSILVVLLAGCDVFSPTACAAICCPLCLPLC
eukprot:m.5452 g.5452  ORF g.5452 m.5452 type:complete len:248 (-) comp2006_c0_seq2:188-931(-)